MEEALLYINEVGKRKNKPKNKSTFPVISRSDIMAAILSESINDFERIKLSNLYAEIICMEKKDLKYISQIAVSSKSDFEVYEIIKKINRAKNINKDQKV